MDLGQSFLIQPDTGIEDSISEISVSLENLQLISDGEYAEYSVESLTSLLKNIKTLHASFTSGVSKLFISGGKRFTTEYDTWYKKNSRGIAKVEKMSYDELKEYDIDYPTGMLATYPEVMSIIMAIFAKSDIFDVFANASKMIDSIQTSISQGSDDCEKKLPGAIATLTSSIKPMLDLHVKLISKFSDTTGSMDRKPFGEMFANMDELIEYRTQLGDSNKVIAKLATLESQLKTIEEGVNVCVDYLLDDAQRGEDEYVPTEKFIKQFSLYLGTVDSAISKHGDVVLRVMALTHNTTYVYKALGVK